MAHVRTVKTASGATAVQIVWSNRRGSRNIEHLGSAHDEAGVAALKAAGAQRIAGGQDQLDLGLGAPHRRRAVADYLLACPTPVVGAVGGLRAAWFR